MGGSDAGSMEMPFPGPAEHDDESGFRLPEFNSDEREIDESGEAPTSIGRTMIRGLGGLIWVIVLIGFTLARNCGGD
jgi:hypothetical protein